MMFNMSNDYTAYKKMEQETKDLVRELINVPKNYSIFFMEGGATGQFAATAINFLKEKGSVGDYLVTGTWSKKASEDCARMGGIPNKIMSDDAKVILCGFMLSGFGCFF
jgi:phosphoserine aminotransferase